MGLRRLAQLIVLALLSPWRCTNSLPQILGTWLVLNGRFILSAKVLVVASLSLTGFLLELPLILTYISLVVLLQVVTLKTLPLVSVRLCLKSTWLKGWRLSISLINKMVRGLPLWQMVIRQLLILHFMEQFVVELQWILIFRPVEFWPKLTLTLETLKSMTIVNLLSVITRFLSFLRLWMFLCVLLTLQVMEFSLEGTILLPIVLLLCLWMLLVCLLVLYWVRFLLLTTFGLRTERLLV